MSSSWDAVGVTAVVVASLAIATHVAIFALEAVWWSRPAVHRAFGVRTPDEAQTMRTLMFNQGFYNLFLAISATVGLVAFAVPDSRWVGVGIAVAALASMAAAAIVLVASQRRLWRASLVQGGPAALAIVLLVASVTTTT